MPFYNDPFVNTSELVTPLYFDLSGLDIAAWLPKGLARTLSHFWPTPLRALRRLYATRARHRIGQELNLRRPLYQVVLPMSNANASLCPTEGGSSNKD